MADFPIPISALPPASTPLTGNEVIPLVQGGATKAALASSIVLSTVFSPSQGGVVPASGGGTATALRADGTWTSTFTGTWTFGTINVTSLLLGPNAAPAFDSATGNIGYYARTAAEISASVTPTNFSYFPGHFFRYGAVADGSTDNALSWAAMIAQANLPGGANPYIPASASGFKVNTGATVTAPISITGQLISGSTVFTTADITILSFSTGASQGSISNLSFHGVGVGATNPGLLFTNVNNHRMSRVGVSLFGVGVRYAPGFVGNKSCFSNTLESCRVISNNSINIDGQSNTNALLLDGTTFGGGPCAVGLKLVDSNNLTISGGDVEGMTLCAIDLDATSTLPAGHVINGLHIEGNTSSAGDVRIGNTAAVNGVSITAAFYPGTGATAGINAVNCNGLFVRYALGSGYTSVPFLMKAILTNEDIAPIGPTSNGLNYRQNNAKINYADQETIGFTDPTSFDAAYQDSSNYNLYRIKSGSVAANKDYFAGFDAIEMTSAGSPGAGAKLYARVCYAANDFGGSTKVGALKAVGDVDIQGPLGVVGQATTGSQTATFTASNKPGTGTTAPAKWVPVMLDGVQYYFPCWT